jgi:hypothetical protein
MGGRLLICIAALLVCAPAAQAETFSLEHTHSGILDAQAQGDVTFPDPGGANVNVTVSDRNEDGWCALAWVTSNLPPSTHKRYQVCGVGKQQTFPLALPATARCDVTFVEVQVGRIDPSNGDKIEVGEAKRILNPCPPPPVTGPPPPPPPPAKIDADARFNWLANRRWTRNTSFSVTGVPAGAAVELRCRGRGCPARKRSIKVSTSGRADVHRTLRRSHLRPGASLELRITRNDMIGKVLRFKIRRGKAPTWRKLCLTPGATSPGRCQ